MTRQRWLIDPRPVVTAESVHRGAVLLRQRDGAGRLTLARSERSFDKARRWARREGVRLDWLNLPRR